MISPLTKIYFGHKAQVNEIQNNILRYFIIWVPIVIIQEPIFYNIEFDIALIHNTIKWVNSATNCDICGYTLIFINLFDS